MKSFITLGATLLGLCATTTFAAVPAIRAVPPARVEERDDTVNLAMDKRQSLSPCVNGPTTRNCWLPGFDINTDMYTSWPTGVVRNVSNFQDRMEQHN